MGDGGWRIGGWFCTSVIGPLWGAGCTSMKQPNIQKKSPRFLVRTSTCDIILNSLILHLGFLYFLGFITLLSYLWFLCLFLWLGGCVCALLTGLELGWCINAQITTRGQVPPFTDSMSWRESFWSWS